MKRKTRRWIYFSWIIVGIIGLLVFWWYFVGEEAVTANPSLKIWFSVSLFAYMIPGFLLGRWSYGKEKDTKNGGKPK